MAEEKDSGNSFAEALSRLAERQGVTPAPAPPEGAARPNAGTYSAEQPKPDTRRVVGECDFCGTGYKSGEIKCSSCGATLPLPGKLSKKEAERLEAERKAAAEAERIRKERWAAKRKKILKIVLPCAAAAVVVIAAVFIGIAVSKANAEKGLFYERYESGYTLTRAGENYAGTDLVVPAEYRGKPVLKIGGRAFTENTSLKSVKIPASVKEIGDCVFERCEALESVTFENGANPLLGDNVFAYCPALKEVSLPGSMKTLGAGMFQGSGLRFIDIPDVGEIPSYIFNNCTGLKAVYIKSGCNSIGYYAFNGCTGLKEFYYESAYEKWLSVYQTGSGIPQAASLYISTRAMSSDGTLYLQEYDAPYNGHFALGATSLFDKTEFTVPLSFNGITVYGVVMDSFEGTALTIPDGILKS